MSARAQHCLSKCQWSLHNTEPGAQIQTEKNDGLQGHMSSLVSKSSGHMHLPSSYGLVVCEGCQYGQRANVISAVLPSSKSADCKHRYATT